MSALNQLSSATVSIFALILLGLRLSREGGKGENLYDVSAVQAMFFLHVQDVMPRRLHRLVLVKDLQGLQSNLLFASGFKSTG